MRSRETAQVLLKGVTAQRSTDRVIAPALATIIVLSTAWMALTLREGHSWYDDFAQYVMQAANTARLEPFAETRYIYDPASPVVGPRLYPPVFPLLLAPVYAVAGIDLTLFKLLGVGCFSVGLLITLCVFRHRLTEAAALQYALIVGFSPAFWELKDYIYSEHLFLPLFYASIFFMDMWYMRRSVFLNPAVHALCLGLLIYLCFGTRTVGFVLIPTLVVCELLRIYLKDPSGTGVLSAFGMRPTSLVAVGALVVAILLCVLQIVAMPQAGSGYFDQLARLSPADILKNVHANSTSFSLLWENGRNEWIRRVGGALLIIVAAVGYLRSNIPRPTPLGIAAAIYFATAMFWTGFAWLRIVWPLLPAFVFYLLIGSDLLARRVRHLGFVPAGIIAFTAVSYLSFYSGADYGPVTDRIDAPSEQELYAFVAGEIDESEAVLFWKPRGLALYSDRRASKFPTRSPSEVVHRAKAIGAPLLVVRNDPESSESVVAGQIAGLRKVFANTRYVAYRLPPATGSEDRSRQPSGGGPEARE